MFNNVTLVGRLTFDPELRYTNQGTAVASIRLAVDGMGEWNADEGKADAGFMNVTVWGKLGEVVAEHLEKGRLVLVNGRLSIRRWQPDWADKEIDSTEVVAESIKFLDYAKEGQDTKGDDPDEGSNRRGSQGKGTPRNSRQGGSSRQGSTSKDRAASKRGRK